MPLGGIPHETAQGGAPGQGLGEGAVKAGPASWADVARERLPDDVLAGVLGMDDVGRTHHAGGIEQKNEMGPCGVHVS